MHRLRLTHDEFNGHLEILVNWNDVNEVDKRWSHNLNEIGVVGSYLGRSSKGTVTMWGPGAENCWCYMKHGGAVYAKAEAATELV